MGIFGLISIIIAVALFIFNIAILANKPTNSKLASGVIIMLASIIIGILGGDHASHLDDPTNDDVLKHKANYVEYKYMNNADTISLYKIEWIRKNYE